MTIQERIGTNLLGLPEHEDMNLLDDETFRMTVRCWVEENYPQEIRNPLKRLHLAESKVWYLKLAEKGWLCPAWPREYGGMGLTSAKQLIMIEEFERYGCARLTDHGVIYLGPLLIRHGTEAQKQYFLPKILSGEHIWCQGYSEPNAGSDLASLRTEAVLDGDEWVINGQKTWTTWATDANWIYMLVRTDKTVKKQDGISFLLVPMNSPGITVRPIVTIDLQDEFCETFFDNVRVPKENLVGAVNTGWSMAKTLLSFERIFVGSPKLSSFALNRLRLLAERMGAWGDPVFQDRYLRLRADLEDLRALYSTFVDAVRRGKTPGPDVSMLKIWQSELYQRISEAMLDVAAENAGLLDPIDGNRELFPGGVFLQARPSTIYAGSNEIQRNIIAKNVLGLPG